MRESIFCKAAELIHSDQVHFDYIGENSGVNYLVKEYPVRIYAKEGLRFIKCGCRNGVFKEALVCSHIMSVCVTEFFRLNPHLVMIDLNDPSFRFKTALEVLKSTEED